MHRLILLTLLHNYASVCTCASKVYDSVFVHIHVDITVMVRGIGIGNTPRYRVWLVSAFERLSCDRVRVCASEKNFSLPTTMNYM